MWPIQGYSDWWLWDKTTVIPPRFLFPVYYATGHQPKQSFNNTVFKSSEGWFNLHSTELLTNQWRMMHSRWPRCMSKIMLGYHVMWERTLFFPTIFSARCLALNLVFLQCVTCYQYVISKGKYFVCLINKLISTQESTRQARIWRKELITANVKTFIKLLIYANVRISSESQAVNLIQCDILNLKCAPESDVP